MRIAILGWGSLIKEPRELPITDGWHNDGPTIWIEFSRISTRGARAHCLTLVIDEESGAEIRSFYTASTRTELQQAIADLKNRESTTSGNIGFCEMATNRFSPTALNRHPQSCERIHTWALQKDFDAVIWTALGPRFKDVLGVPFSPNTAFNYVNGLSASDRDAALDYIHSAPEQTMTPFRRFILQQPGNLASP